MLSLTTYRSKRRIIQVVSTIVIILLPFLSVLRLDIPTLRIYFLNSVLWIDEFYLLFLVIMLILWIIIIFSMLYGRVWCGWMCPQTVLNELERWFEKWIKRRLRIPTKGGSWFQRAVTYFILTISIGLVSLSIGFNLVAYFADPYRMLFEIARGTLGTVEAGFIIGVAILVWIDIIFWREKFCIKACPYGMMQIAITDLHTQIVRYQTERNDECINCKACIRDCMMKIDIRTSPYQTECIHCGDCVDSCVRILSRLNKPTLIAFSWGEKNKQNRWYEKLGFVDAKRWIVLCLTVVYAVGLMTVIELRQPVSITASGDRFTLYRIGSEDRIYNDYAVKISNRCLDEAVFNLAVTSEDVQTNDFKLHTIENPLSLKSNQAQTLKISISTDGRNLHPGPNRLYLTATNLIDKKVKTETEIVFFMPESNSNFMNTKSSLNKN